jgi:hypothetical protein
MSGGQQVTGGDGILEFVHVQPSTVLDAQLAQQSDVRGRSADADAADAAPLPQHRRQAGRRRCGRHSGAGGLKELDRVAGRVVQDDLPAPRPGHDIAAEHDAGAA